MINDPILYRIYNYRNYVSRVMTKPTKWICDQHGTRPACASAQSDQDPCCSLSVFPLVIELESEQHSSWSDCADAHYVGFVVKRLMSFLCAWISWNNCHNVFCNPWYTCYIIYICTIITGDCFPKLYHNCNVLRLVNVICIVLNQWCINIQFSFVRWSHFESLQTWYEIMKTYFIVTFEKRTKRTRTKTMPGCPIFTLL
jgi:hypothetical protein